MLVPQLLSSLLVSWFLFLSFLFACCCLLCWSVCVFVVVVVVFVHGLFLVLSLMRVLLVVLSCVLSSGCCCLCGFVVCRRYCRCGMFVVVGGLSVLLLLPSSLPGVCVARLWLYVLLCVFWLLVLLFVCRSGGSCCCWCWRALVLVCDVCRCRCRRCPVCCVFLALTVRFCGCLRVLVVLLLVFAWFVIAICRWCCDAANGVVL